MLSENQDSRKHPPTTTMGPKEKEDKSQKGIPRACLL